MNRELFILFKNDIGKRPILTRETEYELALRASSGDCIARNILIESNLRFVVKTVFERWYPERFPGLQLMDLISEGYMGLIKASKTFDPYAGFRFLSYAKLAIRQSISSAMWNWRHNRHESLDEPVFNDNDETKIDRLPSEDVQADEKYACEQVKGLLSFLSKREFEIIRLRYWHDMTYEEVGRKIGVSKERVRQSENKALKKLKWHSEEIKNFGEIGIQADQGLREN